MSEALRNMDAALIAIQAATGARKLYGKDHASVGRQLATAASVLGALLMSRRSLRIVRLDNALLFEDAELPSSARLNDVLVPLMVAQGVEWVEFEPGLCAKDLEQWIGRLERGTGGTSVSVSHVRTGRVELGRSDGAARSIRSFSNVAAMSFAAPDAQAHVSELSQIWTQLRTTGARPDGRLSGLVESIRLGAGVGADVCRQLADVKNHDEYTFVHTVNVAILSAALGEAVGMKADQVFDLTAAALLHDVGKQRTPVEILNKPGRLDEAERRRMERHTFDGAAILLARGGVPDFGPIVAFEHHANLDGTGYPNLRRDGRHPHLVSQIVHVADVFDALRTNRPYRAAIDPAKARSILMDAAGKAFDGALLKIFLERVVKVPAPVAASEAA